MPPVKRPSAAMGDEVDDGGAGDAKRAKQGEPEDTSSDDENLDDNLDENQEDNLDENQDENLEENMDENLDENQDENLDDNLEENPVNDPDDEIGAVANHIYERSHERFTWRGVLHPHPDSKKRFKVLSRPRSRKGVDVEGSCNWFAVTTSLRAANRICGIEVGELSWEELYAIVGPNIEHRTTASLRALKYKGIRTAHDYSQGKMDGKRYKISQYFEFFNPERWDSVDCALDRENIKAAIDNILSKSVMLCNFPISENYYEIMENRSEHIYAYDPTRTSPIARGTRVPSHLAVVTGFGFEEDVPYFEFQDCNGEDVAKKGYGRILPTSISLLFGFDIVQD